MSDQSPDLLRRIDRLEHTVADLQANLGAVQYTLHQNRLQVFYPLPAPPPSPAPSARADTSYAHPAPPIAPTAALTAYQPSPRMPAPASAPASTGYTPPATAPRPPGVAPPARPDPPAPAPPPARPPRDFVRSTEYWLNKIGIGLFLLGIMFFFKYSIDKGWITPALRVGLGVLTGFGLLGFGLRLPRERRAFAQVMFGGSIATFYISIFAAFQFYALIPFPLAFGAMVGTTLLGLALGVKQDEVALALIAALGGLATPFLLYTGSSNIPGLIGYTCLLLAGTSAIYFFKGWRSLLWVTLAGGPLILQQAYTTLPFNSEVGQNDRLALQIGAIIVWLLFWLVPVARALGLAPTGVADPAQPTSRLELVISRLVSRLIHPPHQLSLTLGMLTLGFSGAIWQLDRTTLGFVALIGMIVYAIAGLLLHQLANGRALAYTQALVASVMLTVGLALLLRGDVLFWTLAAEAVVIHLLARRLDDPLFTFGAHGLATILACWFILRLEPALSQTAFLNARALTDLAVLASLFAVATRFTVAVDRRLYHLAIHVAVLALLWRELAAYSHATMLAWAGYAALLHVLALRLNREEWLFLAHAACGGVAVLFARSLVELPAPAVPLLNWRAVSDLVVMGLLYALPLIVGRLAGTFSEKRVYRVLIHVALLAWFWRELADYSASWLIAAWAANALGLFALAKREQVEEYAMLANATAIGSAGFFLVALTKVSAQELPILNPTALLQLGAMCLLGAAALVQPQRLVRSVYGVALYVALLLWFWHEWSGIASGNAYITMSWGLCALVLFGIGLRYDRRPILWLAIGTVALVVLKLFLIDLVNLDAIWRILLFIGFGGVFLMLSYVFQSLWRPTPQPSE